MKELTHMRNIVSSNSYQGKDFPKWKAPKSNYVKVPNQLADVIAFLSESEIKVLYYLIRHTWGFQEFGVLKKITHDEFMNGRIKRLKGADGEPVEPPQFVRMDPGTGLSENSVKAALRSLEAQNMIVHTADNSDGGRPKHCYALAMPEEAEDCDES